MKQAGIISRAESLRILKDDLHEAALEKQAAELAEGHSGGPAKDAGPNRTGH